MGFRNSILAVALFCIFLLQTTPGWGMARQQEQPPAQRTEYIFYPEPGQSNETLLAEVLKDFHNRGFLQARLDTFAEDSQKIVLYIDPGPPFFYKIIHHNLEPVLLGLPGVRQALDADSLSFVQFEKLSNTLLTHFQNNGHPFARLQPNIVSIDRQLIKTELRASAHDAVFFDTLQLQNPGILSRRFLEMHSGIRTGMPYDERKVQQLFDRFSDLDFVRFSESPAIRFLPGSARIELPLEKVRINRFDGIAGFSSSENAGEGTRITGLLNLFLANTLGEGESLDLFWQATGQGSQQLSISAAYPYLWRFAIGTELMFALQRRDTTWLQLQFRPALLTQPISGMQWGVFMHYTQGSLISTRAYQQGQAQPQALDFSTRLYGIELRRQSRSYNRLLLQQGYRMRISAAAGNHSIRINTNLPPEIYQDIILKRLQINGEAVLEKRWQTGQLGTFSTGTRLGWFNGRQIPENQLYRLGGFKTLKGFDELSLLASSFTLAWGEYRFFTAENSFLSILANGGWLERKQKNNYTNDLVFAMAAGLNLQTQAGIFALYFALGTQKNIPPEFRNAKIHVGYVSVF